MKIRLTGAVQLEILERYFREAGYTIATPEEIPEVTYDVTSHEAVLAKEVDGFYDERLKALAGCPYSVAGIQAIVEEFKWSLMSSAKKVLAVDADNTLWEGILSEDGRDALKPYSEFQAFLKALSEEGVVLVLLSKNDPGSIEGMDFFTLKAVNWEPKAGNLIEACRELNLGVDSVVFVDDNPHERAQMKAHLPEVTVVDFVPPPTAQFMRRLKEYFFSASAPTREDRLRVADYRNRLRSKSEYLGDLDLRVEARPAEARDLERLAQMASKTNQFNATTLRRSISNLSSLLSSLFIFSTSDKYGEQGIVGYVIVEEDRITDFVMSCRAMGRTLEHFMYNWITARWGRRLPIDFVATPKNAPFAAFLKEVEAGGEPKTYYKEKNHG